MFKTIAITAGLAFEHHYLNFVQCTILSMLIIAQNALKCSKLFYISNC